MSAADMLAAFAGFGLREPLGRFFSTGDGSAFSSSFSFSDSSLRSSSEDVSTGEIFASSGIGLMSPSGSSASSS